MNKALLAIVIILTTLIGAPIITNSLSDVVHVRLRQHIFLIPKHVAMTQQNSLLSLLFNMSFLDNDSHTILFRFNDQEIKSNVAGYKVADDNQFKDEVRGLLMALTSNELNNYKNPEIYAELADLWRGTGSYKNRKIEAADVLGWYKIYRTEEYPNSWTLVSQFPDPEKPVPEQVSDFWIANCLMLGPEEKRSGSCRTHELMGDIVVEFTVSEYNLPVLDKVKSFITKQVLEWKQ